MIIDRPSAQTAPTPTDRQRALRIGVIARSDEMPAVQEFFELFKTPWEIFNPEQPCDVLLTTGEPPAEFNGRLLVVFSSTATRWDARQSLNCHPIRRAGFLDIRGHKIPIYGDAATFSAGTGATAEITSDGAVAAAGSESGETKIIRIGYDLFAEVAFLLSHGQPPENALIPALDLHIDVLRQTIAAAGIPVVEIAPTPTGVAFIACLTHDIDFLRLRQHRFDHTMWGFCFRATVGALLNFARGRMSLRRLMACWAAVLKLPLVHLGLCADFWLPFERYRRIERGKPSTFYLVPFKNRPGASMNGKAPDARATRYDVDDARDWVPALQDEGCEVAVHGIDAWTDTDKGREELNRLAAVTGRKNAGIRMHWLYFSDRSPRALEDAGFDYDSTSGFNEAVGYRAGTSQAFKPLQAKTLLELPMNIQDTAMFFPGRMNLSEAEAWEQCEAVLNHNRRNGGAVTVNWHDRSLVAERLWGDFYAALLEKLSAAGAWFATAKDAVAWFRARRAVRFARLRQAGRRLEMETDHASKGARQDLSIRVSYQTMDGGISHVDVPLNGRRLLTVDLPRDCRCAAEFSAS